MQFLILIFLIMINLTQLIKCNTNGNNQLPNYPRFENMSIKYYANTQAPSVKFLFPLEEINSPKSYCSFFNNRAPTPQINLKNCTWYHENSCCLQAEIESTFSKVKPLIGSSELCQKYVNNLLCYICAPNQFKFYGKERLTVCRQYCDKMYSACGEAILKGSRINEIYSNGQEFCQSRRYLVEDLEDDNCFSYDVESRIVSMSGVSRTISAFSFIFSMLFYLVISM